MSIRRVSPLKAIPAVFLAVATLASAPAQAGSRDRAFFKSAAGTWKGPGEIVAGKYKGTKFICNLIGLANNNRKAGLKLDGSCRVGVFKQPMHAEIIRKNNTYKGAFLDGAKGKGLDIISGNVSGNKVIVSIKRKELTGAMVARMRDKNTLNVTISIRVGRRLVPVIGMTLARDMRAMAAK